MSMQISIDPEDSEFYDSIEADFQEIVSTNTVSILKSESKETNATAEKSIDL